MRLSKTLYILGTLILISSCSARTDYLICEGFNFIVFILALIFGIGFLYGWITQDKDSSSESKRITKEFGCMGAIIVIGIILLLLYKCS